jgi:hypothetical protein
MRRKDFFFTVAVTFAVAVMFKPTLVSAVMFPIVVNNGEGTGTTVTETKTVMFPIVVNQGGGTCTGGAQVRKTGQETCYDASGGTVTCADTGQDGDLQKGVAWPNPRFTDNSNGTVTDNLTGLIWTENADCYAPLKNWQGALTYANAVHPGYSGTEGNCGINDGSSAGDWRLPNIDELLSLVDREYSGPALSNAEGTGQAGITGTVAFTGSFDDCHWTSTTYVSNKSHAWKVVMNTGESSSYSKVSGCRVWLVRDAN